MRLLNNLKQNSKFYSLLIDQVRESSPTFIQNLFPKKKIYNLGACFEVVDLLPYVTEEISDRQFSSLSQLSNVAHLKEATREILIPRIVGTPGHKRVRDYISKSLKDLQWSVELDSFNDTVPILGNLEFHNIIATLNPNAERYLVLACHYDSKYIPNVEFLGATDSAVPCAMMLNLAKVLEAHLQPFRDSKLSLMFIFFDGEEAFKEWGPKDSIYGARHLAAKWESQGLLSRIDVLMLLDLLGAPDPIFYSFFRNTESWYARFLNIEKRLSDAGLMEHYVSSGITRHLPDRYFQPSSLRSSVVEDDHIPFLHREVPILHLIPMPFPSVWHTTDDNETVIDYTTTENLSRIIRLFTMEYLFGILDKDRDYD